MLKQLEPLNDDRRCFRHVGGVLVERTVGEARPQIAQRLAQLDAQFQQLVQERDSKSKALSSFMHEKNIRVQQQPGGQAAPAAD